MSYVGTKGLLLLCNQQILMSALLVQVAAPSFALTQWVASYVGVSMVTSCPMTAEVALVCLLAWGMGCFLIQFPTYVHSDVNECALNGGLGPCSQICINVVGSFACSCLPGYVLLGYNCSGKARRDH